MTPQTVSEMDALLGNKPQSKKESRAWVNQRDDMNMCSQKRQRKQGERWITVCHCFSALPYITTPAWLLQHASSPYHTALYNPTQVSEHNLRIKHGNGCLRHHRNATNNSCYNFFTLRNWSLILPRGSTVDCKRRVKWKWQNACLLAGPDGICRLSCSFRCRLPLFPLPNFHCQILWNGSNVIKVELRVVYSYWQWKALSNIY